MRVRLTQKARSDLIAISDHITEQGSVNADTVLRRIAGRYQQLSVFPNRVWPDPIFSPASACLSSSDGSVLSREA
ncbi:MAG: type II toxin-antitoxin system RelE/ParE family toxin [Tardiphaga sp.]